MSKYLLALIAMFTLTTSYAFAEIQSPIYTDDIGRSHFLGRGGYSSVRPMQMGEAYSGAVNDAVNKYSNDKENLKNEVKKFENSQKALEQTNTDITTVIKEKTEVPVARQKATFSSEKRTIDPSAPYGYGNTYIPSGVNESKTLYKDELGRLHFFGKANKFSDSSN